MTRILEQITDIEELARELFPNGSEHHASRTLQVGDVDDAPGRSATVCLDSGLFWDRAADAGGDLVWVVQQRYGNGNYIAARKWLDDHGWLSDDPAQRKPIPPKPTFTPEARKLQPAPVDTPMPSEEQLLKMAAQTSLDAEPVGAQGHYYRQADGAPVLMVVRYAMPDGGKAMRRCTWGGLVRGWAWWGSSNAVLPLYHLRGLQGQSDADVLIVEGEKAADAGAELTQFAGLVVTCPVGGSNPAQHTDWTPLRGRKVYVLGDADDAGASFAAKVCKQAEGAGASSVQILSPESTYQALVDEDGVPPKGWDIADAITQPEFDPQRDCIACRKRFANAEAVNAHQAQDHKQGDS